MGWLMDYLDIKKVFYIDSVTIGNSVAAMAARVRNVPYMRRDIFLDNSVNADDIDAQFEELIRVAKRKGSAIAIGHPHPETIRVLATNLSRLHGVLNNILPRLVYRRLISAARKNRAD